MRQSQVGIAPGAERQGGWPPEVLAEAMRAFDAVHHGGADWYQASAASQLGVSPARRGRNRGRWKMGR